MTAIVSTMDEMRDTMLEAASSLNRGPTGADAMVRVETDALLQWLADEHFTFLGYREYKLRKRGDKQFLAPIKGTGLGVLSQEVTAARISSDCSCKDRVKIKKAPYWTLYFHFSTKADWEI